MTERSLTHQFRPRQVGTVSSCRRFATVAGIAATAVAIAALSACGETAGGRGASGGHSEPVGSPGSVKASSGSGEPLAALLSRRSQPPPVDVGSSARLADDRLDSRYICGGRGSSPPVTWRRLPSNAKQIVVFVVTLGHGAPLLNWAVGGLMPTMRGLRAGKLPADAVVGRNSFGRDAYSVCPTASRRSSVLSFVVVAVTHPLTLRPDFDASRLLDELTRPGAHEGSLVMVARDDGNTRG